MNAFNPYRYIGQYVMVDLNYRTDEQLKHLRREHGRTAHLRRRSQVPTATLG